MAEARIEAVLEHINYSKGVVGTVVCDREGTPLRDTFENLDRTIACTYADMAAQLARQAALLFDTQALMRQAEKSKAETKPAAALPIAESSLELLRVRTRSNMEIIVQCSDEFLLVVVQQLGVMSRRHIALDLEFIKCRGEYLTRAIAFVPFARSTTTQPSHKAINSDTLVSSDSDGCRTRFVQPATVLSLRPGEVMRRADLLPCGHVLRAHMAKTLVQGDALEAIKRQLAAEVDAGAVAEYRHVLKACQTIVRAAGGEGSKATVNSASTRRRKDLALLPRELQTQLALAEHFTMFDAYGIPNIRRCDGRLLRLLYEAAPDSASYIHAVRELSFLRRCGQGRGKQKSLMYLARYYPRFTQSVLHASFASATQWLTWLEACAGLVETDLVQTSAHHTAASSTTNSEKVKCEVYDSIDDLARAMSCSWHAHLYHTAGCTPSAKDNAHDDNSMGVRSEGSRSESGKGKFYVYGNVDRKVIHATLQLCTQDKATSAPEVNTSSTDSKQTSGNESHAMLRSPFEAHVVDLTTHALFVAAGFTRRNMGKVPALSAALEMTSGADNTARSLRVEGRAHDPLWDARALACVCVGAGIG